MKKEGVQIELMRDVNENGATPLLSDITGRFCSFINPCDTMNV